MYVVTFANPKGGTGKTTAALLLAEQIALSGGRVAMLDLDPNANILAWARARRAAERPVPFAVHARPDPEETVTLIDSLQDQADYLVIDLEGSRDQIVTFALSRSDLCVIPLDGSAMEARQAAAAVRLVQTTAAMIRAPIACRLLMTRTNAAFQTADERDVRRELAASDLPVLPVRLARRAAYTRIFRDGLMLSELWDLTLAEQAGRGASAQTKALSQITGALTNARDYAQAVVAALPTDRAGKEAP